MPYFILLSGERPAIVITVGQAVTSLWELHILGFLVQMAILSQLNLVDSGAAFGACYEYGVIGNYFKECPNCREVVTTPYNTIYKHDPCIVTY